MKRLGLIFIFFSTISTAQTVHNFSLTNITDGKTISLDQFTSSVGVVIIFTSNTCPYDDYYFDRFKDLAETYKTKIPVLLINSHLEEEESIARMKDYASLRNLSIPYLSDKEQRVFRNFNPKKSPECFLLQRSGQNYTIIYRGAVDDNAQSRDDVHRHYLQDAIEKLLKQQKITTPEVRPVGCGFIKK